MSWTAATGSVTGYNVYRGTTAGGESATPINSSPLPASATSYADPTAVGGSTYYYVVKAINGLAISPASNEAGVAMPTSGAVTTVNLAAYYNVSPGITTLGTTFSTSGGLDGSGNALAEAEVGSSIAWNGINFPIGPPNVSDVVQMVGQTIPLPAGNYSSVSFLATSVNNTVNNGQTNLPFVVNYSDGTSTTELQDISDWGMPQYYPGESIALASAYRNTAGGGYNNTSSFEVYGYSIPVDPAKTVVSISLANDMNVKILSMAMRTTLDAPTGLTATAGVNDAVNLSWTASDSPVNGYNVYRYTNGGAAAPTLVGSEVTGTHFTDSTGMPGNTYSYVVEAANGSSNGSAVSPPSNAASVTLASASVTTQADLNSDYNLTGITGDGADFSGGLDGHGNALSETQLGASVTWNGFSFPTGSPNVNDVISGNGQTIALPAGNFSTLTFLATAVNGNQTNQTFTVHYTDGTSTTFTQSLSDWATPQNYAGESVARTTAYRNNSGGGRNSGTFNVYGYTFAVDPTKTIESITLPNDKNVNVLAINLVAPVAAPTNLTATAVSSTTADLSWTAAAGTITGYNVYRGTTVGGESTTPINSSPLSAGATSYADTTAVAGNTYYYVVKAINGIAVSPASTETGTTMPTSGSTVEVDLASQYNLAGITTDGASFGSGLDGHGNALSETEVGTSQTWGSVNFNIAPAGANNMIQAAGQTIGLPNGSYSHVELLATAVNGSQLNQTFTVNYTDGSSTLVTQSMSDWAGPAGFTGESDALSTAYRNTSSGGRVSGTFDVYGYSFAVDSSKTVASITLPDNKNVAVLAITAVGVTSAAPLVTASGDPASTFTPGGSAVAVDTQLSVSSADTDLTGATLTISAATLQTGDLLIFNNQNGITGSYSAGVLTLTGTASVADYEAALQSVTFSTSSANTTARAISIVADDNLLAGNSVLETVDVA